LDVILPIESHPFSSINSYEKPPARGPVKLVDANNIDQLIDLLQNEANAL
jgi:electron transfer flavoprotein beta subunit